MDLPVILVNISASMRTDPDLIPLETSHLHSRRTQHATMVDLGSSGAHLMVRLLSAALLLSAVSMAHSQSRVPIAPDATDGAVGAPNITR